ncbi:MAG: radical SAM family heme chaperone HemW [Dehalococcoidia bacterium]|nr:radical SAM family heme chaperone HemW [Dehalococcoidia bacterium]
MRPISVYVHVPFCTYKCGYCDFNAYAGLESLIPAYRDALVAEIGGYAEVLAGREIATVGFGGGTPSEMPPEGIAAVLDALRAAAPIAGGAEITLEANPGTLTGEHLAGLRSAGVTRLSLGAQSFDAGELRFLDRIHSPEATASALRLARGAGFESVNLDLMYGLPGQTLAAWEASLRAAIALEPDHLSCYCLTVEEGTPLARRVRAGTVATPDGDLAADTYDRAGELLADAGFAQYELSNWARPGHESRHNRVYWTWGEYLGIGAGAHGFVGGERSENIAHPRAYIEAAMRGMRGSAVLAAYTPDAAMMIDDYVSSCLRVTEGFALDAFAREFGGRLEAMAPRWLADCEAAGWLERADGRLRLTLRGRQLHSEVVVRLMGALGAV